jgi:hypothetical protein
VLSVPNSSTFPELHAPPRPWFAAHSATGGPPATCTFLSLLSAKKAMYRLSGDQNGNDASSVPAIWRVVSVASDRSQSE